MKTLISNILIGALVMSSCNFEEKEKPEEVPGNDKDYKVDDTNIIGYYENTGAEAGKIAALDLLDDSTFIAWKLKKDEDVMRRFTGNWNVRASIVELKINNEMVERISLEQLTGENAAFKSLSQPAKDVSEPFISTGKYFYMADAATFIICGSNDIYNVYPNETALEAEKKFMEIEEEFKESFYLKAILTIETKENMEGNPVKQVVFQEILEVNVNESGCQLN